MQHPVEHCQSILTATGPTILISEDTYSQTSGQLKEVAAAFKALKTVQSMQITFTKK